MYPEKMLFVVLLVAIPFAFLSQIFFQRHREKMAAMSRSPERDEIADARLDRIERAIDAMAIEMERVGEGQRFVTKLLADQASPVAVSPLLKSQKFDTPH
ncbi:MAG: hypothetical protein ABJC63_09180 [Gemmatimonadales bacterium]